MHGFMHTNLRNHWKQVKFFDATEWMIIWTFLGSIQRREMIFQVAFDRQIYFFALMHENADHQPSLQCVNRSEQVKTVDCEDVGRKTNSEGQLLLLEWTISNDGKSSRQMIAPGVQRMPIPSENGILLEEKCAVRWIHRCLKIKRRGWKWRNSI